MKRTWLLLDGNNLAWAAFHSMKGLSHGNVATGVTYGMLSRLITLTQQHATPHLVFCWDQGRSKDGLRRQVYSGYKLKRELLAREPEKKAQIKEVSKQMDVLKYEILPYLGLTNNFYQKQYEADDMIASVVQNMSPSDEAIIVSSDRDLYQLLSSGRIFVWAGNKCTTEESLSEEYGVHPQQWVDVKAIAGCNTDDVPGIKGVGEKTAAKFINGQMKKDDKKRLLIKDWIKSHQYLTNLDLVRLPYTGTKDCVPQECSIDPDNWTRLTTRMGMKSITSRVPGRNIGSTFFPRARIK